MKEQAVAQLKSSVGRAQEALRGMVKPYMHLLYEEEGFNLMDEINNINDPILEVAGLTPQGYDFKTQVVKLKKLRTQGKKVYCTDYNPPFSEIRGHKIPTIQLPYTNIDFAANARNLPLKDNSIGALFTSALPFSARPDAINESFRVLKPNGLLLWQYGTLEDFYNMQDTGFIIKQVWELKDKYGSQYNMVMQKNDIENLKTQE